MPPKKKNDDNEMTLKDVSEKLDISESTVKKYIKEFELEGVEGSGVKAIVSTQAFNALNEIVKLRANGLSIQEIKELKTQEPIKDILDEIDDDANAIKANEEKNKKANVEESEEENEIKNEEEEDVDETDEDESEEDIDEEGADGEDSGTDEDEEESELAAEDEVSAPGENGNGNEEDADDESEDEDSEEVKEGSERRKRTFNYRYVERQISTDSKRISSLRQRLRNPNLAVKDRLFFEEALERRILFLDGWKHILRWISLGR